MKSEAGIIGTVKRASVTLVTVLVLMASAVATHSGIDHWW